MILFRRELGDLLRQRRRNQGLTLRDVSRASSCSLGYLSEIERGEKEASSEVLWSVCSALDLPLSDLLSELSDRVALAEGLAAPISLRARSVAQAPAA